MEITVVVIAGLCLLLLWAAAPTKPKEGGGERLARPVPEAPNFAVVKVTLDAGGLKQEPVLFRGTEEKAEESARTLAAQGEFCVDYYVTANSPDLEKRLSREPKLSRRR